MGSCDAADYAAGARVFQEFASTDRSGYLGQTDGVKVGSVNNFYDFWLKLNHFTPSALIALNDTIFGLKSYQITGVLTGVLLVLALPLVFWIPRTMGLGPGASLWLTFIYGISPLSWYAVYHVSPAQILAAQGIAVVTWAGIMMWKDRSGRGWAYAGLLTIGFTIIWGGYNFIVVVCWIPAVACVGGWALAKGEIRRLIVWAGIWLVPLILTGLLFYERGAGVIERFQLFEKADFGWKIAPLWPEGWLGMVHGTGLGAWAWGAGGILTVAAFAGMLIGWIRLLRSNGKQGWAMIAIFVPILMGYGYLQWEGWQTGRNTSYDAYKLFAVFYPVTLMAFCPWLRWLKQSGAWRWAAIGALVLVTAGNIYAMGKMGRRMSRGLLVVEPKLASLQVLESDEQVASMNMLIPDYWERLWANNFLLRKKQHFRIHTYEGRSTSPLRGDWDLSGGLIRVKLPGADSKMINDRYYLARVASSFFLRVKFGQGWYQPELLRSKHTTRWRWSGQTGRLRLSNPHSHPLTVSLHLELRSLAKRDLQVWNGSRLEDTLAVGTTTKVVITSPFVIPPGQTVIRLESAALLTPASDADQRLLGFATYGIVVEVIPDA